MCIQRCSGCLCIGRRQRYLLYSFCYCWHSQMLGSKIQYNRLWCWLSTVQRYRYNQDSFAQTYALCHHTSKPFPLYGTAFFALGLNFLGGDIATSGSTGSRNGIAGSLGGITGLSRVTEFETLHAAPNDTGTIRRARSRRARASIIAFGRDSCSCIHTWEWHPHI